MSWHKLNEPLSSLESCGGLRLLDSDVCTSVSRWHLHALPSLEAKNTRASSFAVDKLRVAMSSPRRNPDARGGRRGETCSLSRCWRLRSAPSSARGSLPQSSSCHSSTTQYRLHCAIPTAQLFRLILAIEDQWAGNDATLAEPTIAVCIRHESD